MPDNTDLQAVATSWVAQRIEERSSQPGVSYLVVLSPTDQWGATNPWPALRVMVGYRGGWSSGWVQGSTFSESAVGMAAEAALAALGLMT